MSLKELSELELESNYTVSDITVHFEDTSGKVLYDNIASTGSLYCYQVSLRNGMFLSSIKSAVKNSDGVLTVSCRLGTGESITVYQGPIKES